MKELVSAIEQRINHSEQPLVLTIGGPTASGKTALARALSDCFSATVLHADDYYYGDTYRNTNFPAELAGNFDHPASFAIGEIADTIITLQMGTVATGPAYDIHTGASLPSAISYQPRPLIVLEGLVANLPEFMAVRDISIAVTALASVRLARRIARDSMQKSHHNNPSVVEAYFWYCAEPMYDRYYRIYDQQADITITT